MKVTTARVCMLSPELIKPNPHNPRRLFDEEPMAILLESIKNLGILVPLDVYPEDPNKTDISKDKFVLLDGERRWRCSQNLNLSKVPCLVVETPNEERNILTMFHIHNVREGWQLMPTALKLQHLMNILKTTSENELSELTKLSISQVRRCKVLLSYPDKYQNMMLAPTSERFKADLFIDLDRIRKPARSVPLPTWINLGDEACIDAMIEKYESGVIKAVTEFRKLAAIYRKCEKDNKVIKFDRELKRFILSKSMTIDEFMVEGASYAKELQEVSRSINRLHKQISTIDFEAISSSEDVVLMLKKLSKLINDKIEDALLTSPQESNS